MEEVVVAVVVVAVRGGRGVTVEARRVCLSRFEKAGSGSVAARAGRGKRAWGQTDPVKGLEDEMDERLEDGRMTGRDVEDRTARSEKVTPAISPSVNVDGAKGRVNSRDRHGLLH